VPLKESWPECPQELADVVHRCLEKETEKRYPSCAHLIRDLEDFRLGLGFADAPGSDSSSSITAPVSVQAVSLLERARRQLDRGRLQRAAMLLEEVLEIDPESQEAKELLERCEPAGEAAEDFAPEDPAARRSRKIQEATRSIEGYVSGRQLGQAAAALRFATRLLGEFDEAHALADGVVGALREDLASLKEAAKGQAHQICERMSQLHAGGRLSLELAEEMNAWSRDFDPEHAAAEELLSELRAEARQRNEAEARARKIAEAVGSIEKLLEEGKPEMAGKALEFAVRLLGDFDQVGVLETRIAEASQRVTSSGSDSP
jgi:tetratricopeptide (TPR) repeat protein